MAISRFDVQSSFIRSIGHEGTTLHVELANGDVHQYDDVPPETFDEFRNAKSLGSFYGKQIRGKYVHRNLSNPKEFP